jgi:hypothetical protein
MKIWQPQGSNIVTRVAVVVHFFKIEQKMQKRKKKLENDQKKLKTLKNISSSI